MKMFYVTLCQLLTCLSHHSSSVVNIIILIGCNLDNAIQIAWTLSGLPKFSFRYALMIAWKSGEHIGALGLKDHVMWCCMDVMWMWWCGVDVVMWGGCGDVRWMWWCQVDVVMWGGSQVDLRRMYADVSGWSTGIESAEFVVHGRFGWSHLQTSTPLHPLTGN